MYFLLLLLLYPFCRVVFVDFSFLFCICYEFFSCEFKFLFFTPSPSLTHTLYYLFRLSYFLHHSLNNFFLLVCCLLVICFNFIFYSFRFVVKHTNTFIVSYTCASRELTERTAQHGSLRRATITATCSQLFLSLSHTLTGHSLTTHFTCIH